MFASLGELYLPRCTHSWINAPVFPWVCGQHLALQCVKTKQEPGAWREEPGLLWCCCLQETAQNFPDPWDQPYFLRLQKKKKKTQRVTISLKRGPGRMSTGLPALGGSEIGSVCVRGSEPDLSAAPCPGTLTMDCRVISFQTSEKTFYLKLHRYFMLL